MDARPASDAGPGSDAIASADGGGGADARPPGDAGPRTCETVTADLRAERETASVCARSSECAVRTHPTCPEGGCFAYYNAGYDLDAMMGYEAEWGALACREGAACRCAPPPETLACVGGHCGECGACEYTCAIDCVCARDACGCDLPICQTSCMDLVAAMQQAAEDVAGCTSDADCTTTTSPLCPELGCFIPHNREASLAHIQALVSQWDAASCRTAACRCIAEPPPVACRDGVCAF